MKTSTSLKVGFLMSLAFCGLTVSAQSQEQGEVLKEIGNYADH